MRLRECLGDEPGSVMVAHLTAGGAPFRVPQDADSCPDALGGRSPVRMILTVDDPDAVFARAVEAGAVEVTPVNDAHGWRIGRIANPFGHYWEIGRPLTS